MTSTPSATFERAMAQSAVGHVLVAALAAIILTISQCARPTQPNEILMDVSLLLGPTTKGEFGAPSPDALTSQDKNEAGETKPVTPPPAPTPPKDAPLPIKDVTLPKPDKIEELKPSDVPIVKEVTKSKPPEKPPLSKPAEPTPTNAVAKAKPTDAKPEPHRVQVSTNVIKLTQAVKDATPKKLGPSRTVLTAEQLAQQLAMGLPKSPGGGSGIRGGGAPGSVERGAMGSATELYKAALRAKLYNAWARPTGVDGLRTVVRVIIARSGATISASITKRSGNEQMDNSAMQAVRAIAPSPLPAGADAPYQIDVEFDASGVSV